MNESHKQALSAVLSSATSITIGGRNVIEVTIPPAAPQLVRMVVQGDDGPVAYLAGHADEVMLTDGKVVVNLTTEGTDVEELTEVELFVDRPLTLEDVAA